MLGLGAGKLYRQLHSDENLTEAWRKVRSNSDAPGVDRVTVSQFGARLFLYLKTLQQELKKRRYWPQPVKRIYVRKSDSSRRPVGILTVRDRVVQRALLQIIGPVFEDGFEECNYAFRQGRSIQHAIDHVTRLVNQGLGWVVDLDISSFFENINTRLLYGFIKEKIKEGELRRLIKAYLDLETAKVERKGLLRKQESRGILQGGILSPLFANVYLDKFDKMALSQGLKLVRYADDILIFCKTKSEAERALRLAQKMLKKLDLEINPRKTQIGHMAKGMRFLGEDLLLKRFGHRERLVVRRRKELEQSEKRGLIPTARTQEATIGG